MGDIVFVISTDKGVHGEITGDAAAGVGTEAISQDEEESLQGLFLGICGIRKGIVVLLVIATTTILPCGKILLLDKGCYSRWCWRCEGDGAGLAQDGGELAG